MNKHIISHFPFPFPIDRMYSRPGPAPLRRRRAPSVPVLLLLLLSAVSLAAGEVTISVANRSGVGVRLHWIHPETGEASFVGNYENKGKESVNTFVGHEFEAREDPTQGGGCDGDTCRMARFQVERGDAGKSESRAAGGRRDVAGVPCRYSHTRPSVRFCTDSRRTEERKYS